MILCFHEIGFSSCEWVITPKHFEEILDKYPNAEIQFDDGRTGVYQFALPILKKRNRKATIFLVPYFIFGKASEKEKYSLFLNFQQIKELINEGWELGSHSYSHSNLTILNDEELLKEMTLSKNFIETSFKVNVNKFAYPFGEVDARVAEIAKRFYSKCYSLDSDLGIKRELISNDLV